MKVEGSPIVKLFDIRIWSFWGWAVIKQGRRKRQTSALWKPMKKQKFALPHPKTEDLKIHWRATTIIHQLRGEPQGGHWSAAEVLHFSRVLDPDTATASWWQLISEENKEESRRVLQAEVLHFSDSRLQRSFLAAFFSIWFYLADTLHKSNILYKLTIIYIYMYIYIFRLDAS